MSGRQYNMYNSQTAEGWKQRILKENLHNAPSLRVFADLEADDDNQSVSSIGSRATGVTRASVASSKASMASTAALNRVRKTTLLPERSNSLSLSADMLCVPRDAPTLATAVARSSARLTGTCHAPSLSCTHTRHATPVAPFCPPPCAALLVPSQALALTQ